MHHMLCFHASSQQACSAQLILQKKMCFYSNFHCSIGGRCAASDMHLLIPVVASWKRADKHPAALHLFVKLRGESLSLTLHYDPPPSIVLKCIQLNVKWEWFVPADAAVRSHFSPHTHTATEVLPQTVAMANSLSCADLWPATVVCWSILRVIMRISGDNQ